jgi:glycosyltransferase involved in cell wall biosynthesis
MTQSLGIGQRVTFTGHLPRAEAQAILERAWVQVVPSTWAEPFGLVAAEALMRGTPVIASDAGGPREIVEHGVSGWTIPTRDVDALAEALAAALSDRGLCEQLGAAGRASAVVRFDENAWIAQYLEIYRQVLDGGRPG